MGHGVFHCERCGGDRAYRQRSGRSWFWLLCVPVVPLDSTGEHLQCMICHTNYRIELLAVPTVEQMRVALLTGTTGSALAMLRTEGSASQAARSRAIELITKAGASEYGEPQLTAALAELEQMPAGEPGSLAVPGLGSALESLAIQFEGYAREWFLGGVIQVGLADGALSAAERDMVGVIAAGLGMSQAQAQDVICLAEEAAQAG
jgi:hypothetical protein